MRHEPRDLLKCYCKRCTVCHNVIDVTFEKSIYGIIIIWYSRDERAGTLHKVSTQIGELEMDGLNLRCASFASHFSRNKSNVTPSLQSSKSAFLKHFLASTFSVRRSLVWVKPPFSS